jgi:hypothetical protein
LQDEDCIRGEREPDAPLVVIQRGCELALFQPRKTGNMDCTFCLDCVQACPHDNVGIIARVPGSELMVDPLRSGLGFFSRRTDLSVLVIVFTFGALLNAFGMVSPVYALESWMAGRLHVNHELPVLALIFTVFLFIEPVVLLSLAAYLTRVLGQLRKPIVPLAVRYSYSLAPLGFGVWLSHYSFHFLTGLFTFVPVAQSAFAALGLPVLGQPRWNLTGLSVNSAHALGYGFLCLGLIGSLLVSYRLAEQDNEQRALRVFAPWAALSFTLFAAAIWLMSQPMEMRGTLLGTG